MVQAFDKDVALRHLRNPKKGDRFTELYEFWVHVVLVEDDNIVLEEYAKNDEHCVPANVKRTLIVHRDHVPIRYTYRTQPDNPWLEYVNNVEWTTLHVPPGATMQWFIDQRGATYNDFERRE